MKEDDYNYWEGGDRLSVLGGGIIEIENDSPDCLQDGFVRNINSILDWSHWMAHSIQNGIASSDEDEWTLSDELIERRSRYHSRLFRESRWVLGEEHPLTKYVRWLFWKITDENDSKD